MPSGVYIRTQEHKDKISKSLMGHTLSQESIEKIKNSNSRLVWFKKGEKAKNWNGFREGHKPTNGFKPGLPPVVHKLGCQCFRCNPNAIRSGWKKGHIPWIKGKKHSNDVIIKLSIAHKGKKLSIEHRKSIGDSLKGEKSYWWKGGVTPINRIIRHSLPYQLWREAILKRDNYTCKKCNNKNGKLHSHHIKSFSKYPELRFEESNGITLCNNCHKYYHTNMGKPIGVIK